MPYCLSLLLSLFISNTTFSQTPVGIWATIDDETGQEKSHVQIYEEAGKQYGKVIKMITARDHLCDRCTDSRKNQPVLGMVIIEEMQLINGTYQNGRVLYPRQGKWYDMKYWLAPNDPDTLVLRGFYGPFYRTQTWKRVQ